jgi:hypothetical protein
MSEAILAIQPEKKKGPGRPKDEAKALQRELEKATKALQREQEKAARALQRELEKAAKPPRAPGRPKDPIKALQKAQEKAEKAAAREQAAAEKVAAREQAAAAKEQTKGLKNRQTPILIPALCAAVNTDDELRAENAMLREKLGQILFVLQSQSC